LDESTANRSVGEEAGDEMEDGITSDKSLSEHDSTHSVELNELPALLDQEHLSTSESKSENEAAQSTSDYTHHTEGEQEQVTQTGVADQHR